MIGIEFVDILRSEFNERLKTYLRENLNLLGFSFNSNEEFIDFLKLNVSRDSLTDGWLGGKYYLNYVDQEDKKLLIGSISSVKEFISKDSTTDSSIMVEFEDLSEVLSLLKSSSIELKLKNFINDGRISDVETL